jgi:hypothetical protein
MPKRLALFPETAGAVHPKRVALLARTRWRFWPVIDTLATRHGKNALFVPRLAALGLRVVVASVDTDCFGTFTGDVPRQGPAREVVERKARAAAADVGADIGLASEGSFGPYPLLPWVTYDHELAVLVDDSSGLVVVGQAVGYEAPSLSKAVGPDDDTTQLLADAGFPEQALIVRPADGSARVIVKAIVDKAVLAKAVRQASAASADGRAVVEPDLRAHMCPSRRKVIARAVDDLVRRLRTPCPHCSSPGFGESNVELGLPCSWCGSATEEVLARILACPACGGVRRVEVPRRADPAHCPVCNP